MRTVAILALTMSLAALVSAQALPQTQECEDVQIQDFAWGVAKRRVSVEDPKFKANSSGRSPNTKDNTVNTIGDPVNIVGVPRDTNPVRPQGGPPSHGFPISANSDTVQSVETRRETYMLVKNAGSKIIHSITWDYIFFSEAAMEHEVKSQRFQSKKKIAPGEVKFLSHSVFKRAPSKYQRVVLQKVEFSDGSTWQRP